MSVVSGDLPLLTSFLPRYRAQHQRRAAGGRLAGGSHGECLLSEATAEYKEPGIQRQSRQHLRAGVRHLRARADVGSAAELHFPVSSGDQETDEEVRPPRPSFCLHLTEFVSKVLLSGQRVVALTF